MFICLAVTVATIIDIETNPAHKQYAEAACAWCYPRPSRLQMEGQNSQPPPALLT